MNGWHREKLGNLVRFRAGTGFPKDIQGDTSGDLPFAKVSDMNRSGNEITLGHAENYISYEQAKALKAYIHKRGAVAFAKIGVALTTNRRRRITRPLVLDNNMMSAEPFEEKLDESFAYFLLSTVDFNEVSSGSALPYLTVSGLSDIEVSLPPLAEQREIASILGALDDKIELNRRMAGTLEELARALYRSWFVDFDPVKAKAEGLAPAFMDEATAALFPDRFGDNGLPEGWRMGRVADVFDVVMGQSPPGNTYNENGEGLPFYQGRTDFGFRFPTRRKFCSAPTRIAAKDSVLLSVRAPVGDLNRAWEKCCIGRGVASLSEKLGRNAYGYEAMWALSDDLKSYDSEGTVFGSINKKQLADLKLVIPTPYLQTAFETLTKPMDEQVRNITANNQTLATLRDNLLPKLMSGELRVGEARDQIEEVT